MRCQSSIRKVRKANIPKAIREQVWLKSFGEIFKQKCHVHWCINIINVWDFHVGHDLPESKGGSLDINNLKKGDKVRVMRGSLSNLTGIFLEKCGQLRSKLLLQFLSQKCQIIVENTDLKRLFS